MGIADGLKAAERLGWDGLVAGGEPFTRPELVLLTGVSPDKSKRIIQYWLKEELVVLLGQEEGRGRRMCNRYRITRKGKRRVDDGQMPSAEGNMWLAIRRQARFFEARDILGHANARGIEVSLAEVKRYCAELATAGYLRLKRKEQGDTPALYQIIRNTGPIAPQPQVLTAVFDPNLGEYSCIYGVTK